MKGEGTERRGVAWLQGSFVGWTPEPGTARREDPAGTGGWLAVSCGGGGSLGERLQQL